MASKISAFAILALAIGTVAIAKPMSVSTVDRPATDIERDVARKPAEILAFAKVKPGQTIVDMLPGGGYFTRVFAHAVGPKGHVIALVSDEYAAKNPKAGTDITSLAAEAGYKNVEAAIRSLGNVAPASTADLVWTAQNYHDLKSAKLPPQTAAFINKAVFAALKPGGYYVILDHSAAAGSGLRDVDTLHRIDAAALKSDVLAAGFKLDGETRILANPADDRTKLVFDPAIRGKTDQFVFRFVKPLK